MPERLMLNKKNFSTESLMLRVVRLFQDPIAMHQQEFAEVVFVLNGSADYGTGPGFRYPINKGEILIVPSHGKHAYHAVENLELFCILFVPERLPLPLLNLYSLEQYRALFGKQAEYYHKVQADYPRLKPEPEEFSELVDLMNKFLHVQKMNSVCSDCEKLGLFMCIIGRLCDIWHRDDQLDSKKRMLDINQVSAYIADHCDQDILLTDLAAMCSMSVSSMLRHFHKAFGTTPIDYLKKIRLDRAATLLLSTSLRVSEIADQCGFSSSSYFIAVFRKKFGKTPDEFRKTAMSVKTYQP